MEWTQNARELSDNNESSHCLGGSDLPRSFGRMLDSYLPPSTGRHFERSSTDNVGAQPWPSQGQRTNETTHFTGQNHTPQQSFVHGVEQNVSIQPRFYRPTEQNITFADVTTPPFVGMKEEIVTPHLQFASTSVANEPRLARAIYKKEFPEIKFAATTKTYDKTVQRPVINNNEASQPRFAPMRSPRAICKKEGTQPQYWTSWEMRKNEAYQPRFAQDAVEDVRSIRGSSRWYTDAVLPPNETHRPFSSVTLSNGLPSPLSLMSRTVGSSMPPNHYVGVMPPNPSGSSYRHNDAVPSTSLMPPSWFLQPHPVPDNHRNNSSASLDHMFRCLAIDLSNQRSNVSSFERDSRCSNRRFGNSDVVWRPSVEETKNHGSGLGESKQYGVPLPPRREEEKSAVTWPNYSKKVFVGGLPPDIDCDMIGRSFERFGALQVGWPHKNEEHSIHPPKGFAFLQFESAESVHLLVKSCQMSDNDSFFTLVSSLSIKDRVVQIRPWIKDNAEFMIDQEKLLERNTVFVGGVPRPLTARALARVMSNMFGPVCYAGIDIDPELGYPKGAGRVIFRSRDSCISAISSRFVQLNMGDMRKSVEVKAFVLQDQDCDGCGGRFCGYKSAAFFCTNVGCLKYLCPMCWAKEHEKIGKEYHKPTLQKCNSFNRNH